VVIIGIATGLAIPGLDRLLAGDQLYVEAPLANNWLWFSAQLISLELVTERTGRGKIVTVVLNVSEY
jgi:hypothetical protein